MQRTMTNFDNWWSHWPRGRKVGKIACRKSYQRQVRILEKEEPDRDPHEYLLEALETFCKSKRFADGYVCNPLTWLNEGRYFDDLEPAVKCGCQSNSRMDETTRQEMARARAIKAERVTTFAVPSADPFKLDDAMYCAHCGAEMFFGKLTNRWQCTTRSCYEVDNASTTR